MKRWLVLGLLVCACGSDNKNNTTPDAGSTGSGTITGSVGGQPLTVKDAVFAVGNNTAIVMVTDRANICPLLAGATLPGPTTALLFSIANFVPPSTLNPLVTGDYAFFDLAADGGTLPSTAGQYWYGEFDGVDANCALTSNHVADGGTVSITQVGNTSGTHLKANLTGIRFGTDALNGSFEAIYCPALGNSSCGAGALLARPPAAE